MALIITENPILDLVFIQIMTLLHFSEAALPLLKWKDSEDPRIASLSVPPAAAWYDKAVGSRLKRLSSSNQPCLTTTGFGIQALSRLSNSLKHSTPEMKIGHSPGTTFCENCEAIAALQLQFSMETLVNNTFSPVEHAAVLEGGSYFLSTRESIKEVNTQEGDLSLVYHHLWENLDIEMTSTMDLASVVRGLVLWNRYKRTTERDDLLTSLVLEILNRKNQSGFLQQGPNPSAPLSKSRQLFILDALLKGFPYTRLDHVLEEVIDTFRQQFPIEGNHAIPFFGSQKEHTGLTAFDLGACLSCLHSVIKYSKDVFPQTDVLRGYIISFLENFTESYLDYHESEIRKLLRWIFMTHEDLVQIEDKPTIRTLIPKRLRISYPEYKIDWKRKGIVSQSAIFFLCSSLLSIAEEEA